MNAWCIGAMWSLENGYLLHTIPVNAAIVLRSYKPGRLLVWKKTLFIYKYLLLLHFNDFTLSLSDSLAANFFDDES
jgi:hypothetical protein